MICDGNQIIAFEGDEASSFSYALNLQNFISTKKSSTEHDKILLDILKGIMFFHSRGETVGRILPTNVLLVNSSGGIRAILSNLRLGSKGCQSDDLRSVGFLLHYVWTSGKQPYGAIHNGTTDTLKNNLIAKMTGPNIGITANDAIENLAFWSKQKRINFLMKVSDVLELKQKKHHDAVEKKSVFGNSWKNNLDPVIVKKIDIDKRRSYDDTSTKDLLRLLRNLSHHFHELAPDIKVSHLFVGHF